MLRRFRCVKIFLKHPYIPPKRFFAHFFPLDWWWGMFRKVHMRFKRQQQQQFRTTATFFPLTGGCSEGLGAPDHQYYFMLAFCTTVLYSFSIINMHTMGRKHTHTINSIIASDSFTQMSVFLVFGNWGFSSLKRRKRKCPTGGERLLNR